jgi:NlpC/P60 family putative phage cell wall peptidase
MTSIRAAIITEAEQWEGTPYHHLASLKHIGCDCIGYIIGIAKSVGVLAADYVPLPYSPQWQLHNTRELLKEGIIACGGHPTVQPAPGDILLFRFGLTASHSAILLPDNSIMHAVLNKRVMRQRLTQAWRQKLDSAYCFPGVC